MHHAGTAHLQPPRVLTDTAAFAAADRAVDREINAGFYEWKEIAPEAHPPLGAEELAGELSKHTLEIGHRDVLVDRESLDLIEHPLVRGVLGFVAIDPTGHDHADRRILRLHHASLHGRGVRAE